MLLSRYVAWNAHEPMPGHYVFNGTYDVVKFIEMAQEEGLLVIVRAGKYMTFTDSHSFYDRHNSLFIDMKAELLVPLLILLKYCTNFEGQNA